MGREGGREGGSERGNEGGRVLVMFDSFDSVSLRNHVYCKRIDG